MMRFMTKIAMLLTVPGVLAAQLPQSSTRAVGMGTSYTASAAGFEAVQWNPAMLGLSDQPGFSLNLIQSSVELGSNSYTIDDFFTYSGEFLTDADKQDLLDKVTGEDPDGNLEIEGLVGVTGLAASYRNFAISITGTGSFSGGLSGDFLELLLFGNARRRDRGDVFTGAGTQGRGWSAGVIAGSYGRSFPVPIGELAVGITGKFIRGVGFGGVVDLNSSLQNVPFEARVGVHALGHDLDARTFNGSGVGFDIGGAYRLKHNLQFGLVVENLINTMSWDEDNLLYYRQEFEVIQQGDALVDRTVSDISEAAFDPTDPVQRELADSLLEDASFPTRVRAGVQYDAGPVLVVGDASVRLLDGLQFGESQRISAGAELTLIPVVRPRVGLATNFEGGVTFAGGLGFKFGPVRLDAAVSNTPGGGRKGFQIAGGLSIM